MKITVVAIDEGWELWVSEGDQRLVCGGRISVDQAMAGWRVGEDRVLELAEEVKSNVLTGKLGLMARPVAVVPPSAPADTSSSA